MPRGLLLRVFTGVTDAGLHVHVHAGAGVCDTVAARQPGDTVLGVGAFAKATLQQATNPAIPGNESIDA